MRRRLLDLFCCEGGAGEGFMRAGWEVVGVDLDAARGRYYPGTFVHADALDYAAEHGDTFDAIHASPPCQAYSVTRHTHDLEHPELVPDTRELLRAIGRPYSIENVPGAPLVDPITLCGAAFGLTATETDGTRLVLKRHRLIESNVLIPDVECMCLLYRRRGFQVAGVYGGGASDNRAKEGRGGYTPRAAVAAALIGAEHRMTLRGLSQSIPPAYGEYVATWLAAALDAGVVAA